MKHNLTFKPLNNYTILIEWQATIDEKTLQEVLIFKNFIQDESAKQILYVSHSYNSLLVFYDFTIKNIYDEILTLKTLCSKDFKTKDQKSTLYKIPVCYDEKFGIDLQEISEVKQLETSEIIKRHSQPNYTVFFTGFLPGFLYLGGLDKSLHFSRKKKPRLHIKKGAVAIGEKQTGIYPNSSPGGWNIIGNSPLNFFDVSKPNPCIAKAGDKIKFVPISLEEHQVITQQVLEQTYQIESEVLHA